MKQLSVICWTALLVTLSPLSGAATSESTLSADHKRLQIIKWALDDTFSACDEFFNYACKGLLEYEDQFDGSNLEYLDDRIGEELYKDIRQLRPTTEFKFLREIRNYYKSCNEVENEQDTVQYLKWMSAYAGIHENMDWIELLAAARKYGFNEIFVLEDTTPRQDDALQMAIELKSPALWSDTPVEWTSKFYNFEITLSRLADRYHDDSRVRSSISLQNLNVTWVNKYIQYLLGQSQVNTSMIVYVQNKEYLKGLGQLLSQYDNSFLCDYIQTKFLMSLKYQDDAMYRRGSCELNVRNLFPLPMQWIYTKSHPELQQDLPRIRNMFDYLKATFKKTLTRNIYNFPADIVEYLQAKIDSIQLSAGAMSVEDLEKFYENLHLNASEYFGNRLRLANFDFNITHQLISKRLVRNSITMLSLRPPYDRESAFERADLYKLPYLFPRFNLVYLPLTLLQYPYYERGLADVYSFSCIGFLMAREITKAFRLQHLRVDADGRYNTVAEVAIQSNTEFQKNIRNRYDSLNAINTIPDEEFGDISGLKLAYDTMLELHPDPWSIHVKLLGKKVKMDQIFFLSFANNYCGIRSFFGIFHLQSHTAQLRLKAATRHFDKFGQAFKCGNSTPNQLWR